MFLQITIRKNFYSDIRRNNIGKESQIDILKSAYGKVCENVHNCYLLPQLLLLAILFENLDTVVLLHDWEEAVPLSLVTLVMLVLEYYLFWKRLSHQEYRTQIPWEKPSSQLSRVSEIKLKICIYTHTYLTITLPFSFSKHVFFQLIFCLIHPNYNIP